MDQIIGFGSLAILSVAVFTLWVWRNFSTTVIYDYENGLLYKNGAFVKLLGAGVYRLNTRRSKIETVDMRKQPLTLSGQDILTKDHVNVRVTLVGQFQIFDVQLAVRAIASHQAELYTMAQLAVRDHVGSMALEEILQRKSDLDAMLLKTVAEGAKTLGLTILALAVRDVMLPANLKKAFSGALEAQKEAQRQLEVARGEQAVLRSLANSARLYENNPMLMQARIIQALSTGNNSIVFGADEKITLKPKAQK
jgi:regulator of protease activity HflC (stomatin/prohibitin superfamily)